MEVESTKRIRDLKFPELKQILDYENRLKLFMGEIQLVNEKGEVLFKDKAAIYILLRIRCNAFVERKDNAPNDIIKSRQSSD